LSAPLPGRSSFTRKPDQARVDWYLFNSGYWVNCAEPGAKVYQFVPPWLSIVQFCPIWIQWAFCKGLFFKRGLTAKFGMIVEVFISKCMKKIRLAILQEKDAFISVMIDPPDAGQQG
ncbi:MAG: hypothetical protein D6814_10705, partial [Calditrichaeota bacterium]